MQDGFSINKKRQKFIPGYSIFPLLTLVIINFAVYNGTRLLTDEMHHYDFSLVVDKHISLMPVFVVPYLLAYVQWIAGYILISRVGKDFCYQYIGGEIFAKVMVGIIFVLIPTTMRRPEILVNNYWMKMVDLIYKIDPPTNLFPSVHCMESWICFRACLKMKSVRKSIKIFVGILTFTIFLSTVFMKQHVVVDIIGGVLIAEAGLFLGRIIWKKKRNNQNIEYNKI